MKLFQVILISILLLVLVEVISQLSSMRVADQYYAKTISIECNVNPLQIVNKSCKLKPVNWEQSFAYLDGDLIHVVRNATLRLELYKYTNQYRPYLLNMTVDFCNILESSHGNRYMLTVLKVVSNYTNLSHRCPYSGHLHASGVYLDLHFVPFFIPIGRYKFVFTFYKDWPLVHVGTFTMSVIILEKNNATVKTKNTKLKHKFP